MEILNLKSDSLERNMSTELTDPVEENAGQTTTWSMEILPHNISIRHTTFCICNANKYLTDYIKEYMKYF